MLWAFSQFITHPIFWSVLVFILILNWWFNESRYHLPPKPHSWPIIGNYFGIPTDTPLYRWCQELKQEYGPILRVTLGLSDVVVLSDYECIHEAMVQKSWQFAGRPQLTAFEILHEKESNISFSDPDSPPWIIRRKLVVQSLRNFTKGREYEERVFVSLSKLCDMFDEKAKREDKFDPGDAIKALVYNYSAHLCFGKNLEFNDRQSLILHDANQKFAESFDTPISIDVFPVLRHLPFAMPDVIRLQKLVGDPIKNYIEENFAEHKRTFVSGKASDLTYYMMNVAAESNEQDAINDASIREMISELFNAGLDTSRATLQWLLLCLSKRQDVQERIVQEIDDVIGEHDLIKFSEGHSVLHFRPQMPYSEAVLTECMRFGTVAPMGLVRKTLCDATVGKFDVPKGTQVFVNQWAVNFNEAIFTQPKEFRPEHFISKEGGFKRSTHLSFGLGRRMCPGESAARSTIWLALLSLVQRYAINTPGEKYPQFKDCDSLYSDSLFDGSPKPFFIALTPRRKFK